MEYFVEIMNKLFHGNSQKNQVAKTNIRNACKCKTSEILALIKQGIFFFKNTYNYLLLKRKSREPMCKLNILLSYCRSKFLSAIYVDWRVIFLNHSILNIQRKCIFVDVVFTLVVSFLFLLYTFCVKMG